MDSYEGQLFGVQGKLWEMCFGSEKQMKVLFLNVPQVREAIRNAVIGFSDQVPWWGLVQMEKQLYLHSELERTPAGHHFQKRGFDNDEPSKFRLTLELRQLVLHWFDDTKEPVGVMGKSLLVVGGVHCRLWNIDADGRWIKTETFWVGAQQVTRIAGRSARGAMAAWVKLRSERPELFELVDVAQQPAAVMDAILSSWVVEQQGRTQ